MLFKKAVSNTLEKLNNVIVKEDNVFSKVNNILREININSYENTSIRVDAF